MENLNNLPALQKNQQDLVSLEQNKPYLLMLKENESKWKTVTAEVKEDCLDFMLDILNIKVLDEEEQNHIDRQLILVADLISNYFSNLTAGEIKEAFKLYVAKKFSDVKVFRLIDCVAVGEILNAYIEYRNQSVEPFVNKRQNLLNAPAEKSESEKEKIFNDFVKMIYNEILEKEYSEGAWYLFKKLEENKSICVSNEEKSKLYKKELAIYVPTERQRIIKQNPLSGRGLLKDFEKTYEGNKKPVYVQNRCRSILVCKFIKEKIKSLEGLQLILKN